jgi:hypothetical protein
MIQLNYHCFVKFRDICFLQKNNLVVSLPSTSSACFLTAFHQTFKSMKKVNQTFFILELNVIYFHRFRKIKTKKELPLTTCNFTICYKVTCNLTTHLFDWMIVGFLTSSGKYVINIQDDNSLCIFKTIIISTFCAGLSYCLLIIYIFMADIIIKQGVVLQ